MNVSYHTLRKLGGVALAGVTVERSDVDWRALISKNGMIAVLDEIVASHHWNLTATNGADDSVVYEHVAPVCTSLNLQDAVGNVELISGCDGGLVTVHHILSRMTTSDAIVTDNTQESGVTQCVLWQGTYPWDLEEYTMRVADLGAFSYVRGGASGFQTVTTDTCKLLVRGRYLSSLGEYRKRRWIKRAPQGDQAYLPPGRYHCIVIANDVAANGNLYDSGIEVTSPNFQVTREDGRHLQRCFERDYCTNFNATVPDDSCAQALTLGGLEDVLQPIYVPPPESIRWESGVLGPVTITKQTGDPAMNVYALQCVE